MPSNACGCSLEGFTVWLTGLPCSGKSTISIELARCLRLLGHRVEVLDGDLVREHLSKGLGYSREDREENVRRIAYVSGLLARNGVVVIVAAVSPFVAMRAEARRQLGRFSEVYVNCPLAECERRDVKGMYARARAGELLGFTGVDAPYEPPPAPDVTLDTEREGVEECVHRITRALRQQGYLATPP